MIPEDVARERELMRLRHTSGPSTTDLLGFRMRVAHGPEFVAQYKQFFVAQMLAGVRPRPGRRAVLVDLGANIGTCVAWFKRLFPDGEVVAVEADPAISPLLVANLAAAGFRDVRVIEAAAWNATGYADLHSDGITGSRLSQVGGLPDVSRPPVRVRTVDVLDVMPDQVTLLKIDIEGAEVTVLERLRHRIQDVDYLHIEVHEFSARSRKLPVVLGLLEDVGLEYHVAPLHLDPRPFQERESWCGVVNPLAIYAWQPWARPELREVADGMGPAHDGDRSPA